MEKEYVRSEYDFTVAESNRLIEGCRNLGFEPVPYLVKDKTFEVCTVRDTIHFKHIKSGFSLTLEKWILENLALDIILEPIDNIIFMTLLKKAEDEDYVRSYNP